MMFDLQLFSEGSMGDGGAAAESQGAQGTASQSRDAAGTDKTSERVSFDELIQGEYRDDFHNRVEEIVKKRVKNSRLQGEQLNSQKKVLDAVAAAYGLQNPTEQEFLSAIQQKKGEKVMSKAFIEAADAGMQAIVPGFSMENEMKRPIFKAMINADLPVETAYRVAHHEEILGSAMAYTAQQMQQNALNSFQRRNARPAENAVSGGAAVTTKTSVRDLTEKDLIDIEKRVMRGEKVSW